MWDFFQTATIAYVMGNYPGLLMILMGGVLAIVTTWKHGQRATTWKFNPRQVMDGVIGLTIVFLIGLGTWLLFTWSP